MIHELKTWPQYFEGILSGAKTFDLRWDDRGYAVGDTLVLKEWDPDAEDYTGRECQRTVTYLLDTREFLPVIDPWVILSLSGSV